MERPFFFRKRRKSKKWRVSLYGVGMTERGKAKRGLITIRHSTGPTVGSFGGNRALPQKLTTVVLVRSGQHGSDLITSDAGGIYGHEIGTPLQQRKASARGGERGAASMPRSLLIISHHTFGFSLPPDLSQGKRKRRGCTRLYGMSMRYLSRLEITKGGRQKG